MSKKWKSSKAVTVDGDAFKQARHSFVSKDESVCRGEYRYGSQEWLAQQSRISPRTVNSLETGRATIKTIDAVSKVLDINGREYILGYGEDFTSFHASRVVDFRPSINGRISGNEKAYLEAPFFVTLDPIIVTVQDDFIEESVLQKMNLKLSVGEMNIDFKWLYSVRLTDQSQTWLGDEKDVNPLKIYTREPYNSSIMFKQNLFESISWREFIDIVRSTKSRKILISLELVFDRFKKEGNILVSVEEIKNLFEKGYPNGYPYWVQPNSLMDSSN